MFEKFFRNVMGRGSSDKERIASKEYSRALWYYGYELHGTKRQSTARMWLLYDLQSGNNGRTGKTIIANSLGKIQPMAIIDGKRIDLSDRFAFQTVEPWTRILLIDDIAKGSSLAPLFNIITGKMIADRKGLAPIINEDLKVVGTSNYILESEGRSEAGRQFVSQASDFYIRWGQEHGNTISPVVDYHGKEFYTDWDKGDWNQFDNFAMRALMHYFSAKPPDNTIIGNSAIVRFIQMNEEELFFTLCRTLSEHVKPMGSGELAVPQEIMSEAVKRENVDMKSNRAGKIVRSFLHAIGCPKISMTTVKVGGLLRNAYLLGITQWSDIDIGDYKRTIPPPKF